MVGRGDRLLVGVVDDRSGVGEGGREETAHNVSVRSEVKSDKNKVCRLHSKSVTVPPAGIDTFSSPPFSVCLPVSF